MHILSTPVSLHLNFKIKFLLENCYILINLSIFFLTLNLCIDFSHPLLIIFFNAKKILIWSLIFLLLPLDPVITSFSLWSFNSPCSLGISPKILFSFNLQLHLSFLDDKWYIPFKQPNQFIAYNSHVKWGSQNGQILSEAFICTIDFSIIKWCSYIHIWTEEPGRLQSLGSLGVRHDWVTSLSLLTFMHWRRKWQPTPVFLPGESQGRGSLVGCCLWCRAESDTTEAT